MHETDPIELELKEEAKRLSEKYRTPIVIIAAGSASTPGSIYNVYRTMTASYDVDGSLIRLRDLLGILEASKQLETYKHLSVIK